MVYNTCRIHIILSSTSVSEEHSNPYVLKIPKSSKERLKLHKVKNLEESKQQFISLARLWSYLDEGVFGEEPKNDKATGDNEVNKEG